MKEPHSLTSEGRLIVECLNTGKHNTAFLRARQSAYKDGDCAALLALCYLDGIGSNIDLKEGVRWAKFAAEKGSELGKGAHLFLLKKYAEALPCVLPMADAGVSAAQNIAGVCHHQVGDALSGYKYCHQAADQGYAVASYHAGCHLIEGNGVPKDLKKGIHFLTKSVETGLAAPQNLLGVHYLNGEGVEQDYKKAVELFRQASDQGNFSAQNNLGDCYLEGKGVDQDDGMAVRYYRMAAEKGDATGQYNMGYGFAVGKGLPQDDSMAVHYFLLAAEQGFSSAQVRLAEHYEDGRGVEKEMDLAKKFYQKAADQENEEAIEALKRLNEEEEK